MNTVLQFSNFSLKYYTTDVKSILRTFSGLNRPKKKERSASAQKLDVLIKKKKKSVLTILSS